MAFATFGTAVRAWRDSAKLTQQELGDAIGVVQEQVSRIEGDKRALTPAQLPALCRALKLDTEQAREAYALCGVDLSPVIGPDSDRLGA